MGFLPGAHYICLYLGVDLYSSAISVSYISIDLRHVILMSRSRTQFIPLSDFFPANDPIAVSMARLCILREDLMLEAQAVRLENGGVLDSNGKEWRRLYFWRNSFKTLESVRSALQTLSGQKRFQEILEKEPKEIQKGFQNLTKALSKVSAEFLKTLRNDLGGHVQHSAIESTLARLDPLEKGLLEISDGLVGKQHYRFTSRLVLSMMLPRGKSLERPERELKRRSRKVALLMWAVLIIDEIFNSYVKSRRLLE